MLKKMQKYYIYIFYIYISEINYILIYIQTENSSFKL